MRYASNVGFYLNGHGVYQVSELDRLQWLAHGFGTRNADVPRQFENLATLKQVHGAECVDACGRAGILGQGDALLENSPGAVVAVKTADCIPIILVDDEQRAVAVVHAGWRGTAAGIAARAVNAMQIRFGTDANRLHAAIGPGIGECCFEVGPEVSAQFGRTGRAHIDLEAENRRQLLQSGVTAERIYASGMCTMCRTGEFHSFRRDREAAGRMHTFAGVMRAVE